MKTSLLLIPAFLCIALSSIAQGPTLTAANSTFLVGEKFYNQNVSVSSAPELSGGANQTWDYSAVVDSGLIDGVGVVTPQSTPFADSFPTSNLVVKALNDTAFLYYNSSSTSLRQLGFSITDGTTLRYDPSKIYLPFPFSYNSFFTDSVAQVSKTFGILFAGRDTLTGDGYGTLIIPGGSGNQTYNNVLRIKYIENISNTTEISGIKTTINLRGVAYVYFTPDEHAPLFYNSTIISTTTITIFGTPISTSSAVKNVSYLEDAMLPLSFTSFNAALNNNQVSLKWQTAQEINTGHFNVQRTLTGSDFKDIAEIKATGNSIASNYTYTDQEFLKPGVPPTVYYRIKETDKDGKEFYSETRVVHGNGGTISLYPNPASNYINFKGAGVADAISIYDAKGNLVKQVYNYQLSQPLNISSFGKGSYFIKIKIANEITNTTFVKQ